MATTLFGETEDIAKPPLNPAPEHVVRKLVSLGVSESKARGFESRQAFVVLSKLEARVASSLARAGEIGEEPPRIDRGASYPERHQAADDLASMLVNEMGDPWERICQRYVCCLYTLTRSEFRRLVEATIRELRTEVQ